MAIENRLDVVEPDMVDGKKGGSSSGTGREDAHHVVTTSSHGEGGGVDNVSHACGEEERNMDARRKMLGENMLTPINYYGYKCGCHDTEYLPMPIMARTKETVPAKSPNMPD